MRRRHGKGWAAARDGGRELSARAWDVSAGVFQRLLEVRALHLLRLEPSHLRRLGLALLRSPRRSLRSELLVPILDALHIGRLQRAEALDLGDGAEALRKLGHALQMAPRGHHVVTGPGCGRACHIVERARARMCVIRERACTRARERGGDGRSCTDAEHALIDLCLARLARRAVGLSTQAQHWLADGAWCVAWRHVAGLVGASGGLTLEYSTEYSVDDIARSRLVVGDPGEEGSTSAHGVSFARALVLV